MLFVREVPLFTETADKKKKNPILCLVYCRVLTRVCFIAMAFYCLAAHMTLVNLNGKSCVYSNVRTMPRKQNPCKFSFWLKGRGYQKKF